MEYSELYVKRIRALCKERGIAINMYERHHLKKSHMAQLAAQVK